jgi:hypothetical protein
LRGPDLPRVAIAVSYAHSDPFGFNRIFRGAYIVQRSEQGDVGFSLGRRHSIQTEGPGVGGLVLPLSAIASGKATAGRFGTVKEPYIDDVLDGTDTVHRIC